MDLDSAVGYNGVTLQPPTAQPTGGAAAGVKIIRINVSPVATDAYYDNAANRDGVDASDIFMRGRTISIDAAAYGTSKGQVFDQLQDVLAAFHPRLAYLADEDEYGFLPLTFRQPTIDTTTWTAGYIPMQYHARPIAPPRYDVSAVRTTDNGRGFSIPVSMSLFAKDAAKFHQSTVSAALGSTNLSLAYRGDLYSWPIVQFTLSANASSAFTILTDSMSVILDLSSAYSVVPSQKSWLLDFEGPTLYQATSKTRSSTRNELISTASNFTTVGPGSVSRVNSTTGIDGGLVRMTYREAWA